MGQSSVTACWSITVTTPPPGARAKATELFTTDTMVEGVHFNRNTTPWTDLGWKSLASNISDIAAMGGLPMYALVTLGLPPETEVEDLKELYAGMMQISKNYGVAIVGGDLVRSPVVFITVSLTGVHPDKPMLRTAARAGDEIGVTGYVGSSGAGLRLLLEDTPAPSEAAKYLRECHRRPHPATEQGRLLSKLGVDTAMDISDGLADDLSKLCQASGLSARIYADQVPVHPLVETDLSRRLAGPGPQRRRGLPASVQRPVPPDAGGFAPPTGRICPDWRNYRRHSRPGGHRRIRWSRNRRSSRWLGPLPLTP